MLYWSGALTNVDLWCQEDPGVDNFYSFQNFLSLFLNVTILNDFFFQSQPQINDSWKGHGKWLWVHLTLVVDGILNNNADNMQPSVPIAFSAWPQDEINTEDK